MFNIIPIIWSSILMEKKYTTNGIKQIQICFYDNVRDSRKHATRHHGDCYLFYKSVCVCVRGREIDFCNVVGADYSKSTHTYQRIIISIRITNLMYLLFLDLRPQNEEHEYLSLSRQ